MEEIVLMTLPQDTFHTHNMEETGYIKKNKQMKKIGLITHPWTQHTQSMEKSGSLSRLGSNMTALWQNYLTKSRWITQFLLKSFSFKEFHLYLHITVGFV